MPILYLAGSLGGIALLVGLNFLLFGRVRPDVGSAEEIAGRLKRDIPGFRLGSAMVSTDGRAALIENAANRSIFLVEALGDGMVTRQISRGLLLSVGRLGERLSIELRDFTFPRATIWAASDGLAREWEMRLKP